MNSKEQEFYCVSSPAQPPPPPATPASEKQNETQQEATARQPLQPVQAAGESVLTTGGTLHASAISATVKSASTGTNTVVRQVSSNSNPEAAGSAASTSIDSLPHHFTDANTAGTTTSLLDKSFDEVPAAASPSGTERQDSTRSMQKVPGGAPAGRWEEKKTNFRTCAPEELLSDVSNLSYLGSGGKEIC